MTYTRGGKHRLFFSVGQHFKLKLGGKMEWVEKAIDQDADKESFSLSIIGYETKTSVEFKGGYMDLFSVVMGGLGLFSLLATAAILLYLLLIGER